MRKRIAILSFYSGHIERGVETWVKGLAKELKKNNEVSVFQAKSNSIDWKQKDSKGTLKRRLFIDYWSLIIFKFNFLILKKLDNFNPDIIIATDGGWEPAIMRIYTWITGKKLVIVGQAGIGWDEYNNIYSFPDCFVALSEHAANWARKSNPFIRVETIPNAVNVGKFDSKARGRGKHEPLIISVGALEKGKRMGNVIRAVAKLKKARLLILGKGEQQDFLSDLGNKLMGNRFSLKSVKHKDINKYYSNADLFVSASGSRYAFEIVLIEAMANNLPVVVNNDPIRREIVFNAGLYSDPDDINSLYKTIKKALSKRWGSKPRQQALKFSWEKVARKYNLLFNSL